MLGTTRSSEILNILLVITIAIILVHFIVLPVARLVLYFRNFHRLKGRPLVFLEITPTITTAKTPLATAQFCAALHGLLIGKS